MEGIFIDLETAKKIAQIDKEKEQVIVWKYVN